MMNTVFEIIGMGSKKYGGFEKYIVEEARQLKDKDYRLVVIFDRQPLATEYVTDLENLGGGSRGVATDLLGTVRQRLCRTA